MSGQLLHTVTYLLFSLIPETRRGEEFDRSCVGASSDPLHEHAWLFAPLQPAPAPRLCRATRRRRALRRVLLRLGRRPALLRRQLLLLHGHCLLLCWVLEQLPLEIRLWRRFVQQCFVSSYVSLSLSLCVCLSMRVFLF